MADDQRRAEIEAVARELKHNDECGPGPVSEEEYRADAKEIIEALDRVRDARGDDEKPQLQTNLTLRPQSTTGLGGLRYPLTATQIVESRSPQGEDHKYVCPNGHRILAEKTVLCDECPGLTVYVPMSRLIAERERSPQDEDHEAGLEAATRALDTWWPVGISPERMNHHRADIAITAYLDHVRDARGDDMAGIPYCDVCRCFRPAKQCGFESYGQKRPENCPQPPQDEDHDPDERALDTPLGARQRAQTQRDVVDTLEFGSPQDEDPTDNSTDKPPLQYGSVTPQGEGHEAGIGAVVSLIAGGNDEWKRMRAEEIVAAYLSRVSSSRPEQPPPDVLGGQPPAEPPDNP